LKAAKKIIRLLGTVQLYAGVVCMGVIILAVTAGIISRKAFDAPLSWVEELCTFMFIYLAFFGASVAAMNGKHVSADFLTQKFSPRGAKILAVVQRLFVLVLLGFMFVSSIILLPKMGGHSSTSLGIPKNYYFVPIMFSSLYMFFVYLIELIEAAQAVGKKGGD